MPKLPQKKLLKLIGKRTKITTTQSVKSTTYSQDWVCMGKLSANGYLIFVLNDKAEIYVKEKGEGKVVKHKKPQTPYFVPHFTLLVGNTSHKDYKDKVLKRFHLSLVGGKHKLLHKFRTSDGGYTNSRNPDYSDVAKDFITKLASKC